MVLRSEPSRRQSIVKNGSTKHKIPMLTLKREPVDIPSKVIIHAGVAGTVS